MLCVCLCARRAGVYHGDLRHRKSPGRLRVHFLSITPRAMPFVMIFISQRPQSTGSGVEGAIFLFPYCHFQIISLPIKNPNFFVL